MPQETPNPQESSQKLHRALEHLWADHPNRAQLHRDIDSGIEVMVQAQSRALAQLQARPSADIQAFLRALNQEHFHGAILIVSHSLAQNRAEISRLQAQNRALNRALAQSEAQIGEVVRVLAQALAEAGRAPVQAEPEIQAEETDYEE